MLVTSTRKALITGSGKLVSFSQRTLWIDVFILPTYYLKTLSDSMSNEEKAIELITQAEKKVKSSQGFLGGLFG